MTDTITIYKRPELVLPPGGRPTVPQRPEQAHHSGERPQAPQRPNGDIPLPDGRRLSPAATICR